ncbi:MAG: HpcH/HpaI aldolase/citrate lyase family protein [Monoglobaceae bacterium]
MKNIIREKVIRNDFIFGSHIFCGEPMITEAIALCGYDVIWIDMEHTAIDKESVQNNLIAVRAGGSHSFVRIAWNDPVMAKPILDMGPDGIIFPYICSADEAKRAIESCLYPPEGTRGYGPLRALEYGNIEPCDYVDREYDKTMRIIQIEHIDAVNCLEKIIEIDGVDGIIVGPNDLSGSMGHIGRPNHPDMIPVYDRIGDIMRGRNKFFGVSVGYDEQIINCWINRGINALFSGTDIGFIHDGATKHLKKMIKLKNSKKIIV